MSSAASARVVRAGSVGATASGERRARRRASACTLVAADPRASPSGPAGRPAAAAAAAARDDE